MSWNDAPQTAPEAGWYADPAGSGGLRYWDGSTWTGHVTPPRPPVAAAGPAGPPGAPPGFAPAYATVAPKAKTPVWVWILLAAIALLFVIGLLAAVLVPTVGVVRDAAWDEEAKTNVLDAYDAAVILRSTSGSYFQATPESLARTEPRLKYTTSASDGPEVVSVYPLDQLVTLTVRSRSGTCWVIQDDAEVMGRGGFRSGRVGGEGVGCAASSGTAGLVEEDF